MVCALTLRRGRRPLRGPLRARHAARRGGGGGAAALPLVRHRLPGRPAGAGGGAGVAAQRQRLPLRRRAAGLRRAGAPLGARSGDAGDARPVQLRRRRESAEPVRGASEDRSARPASCSTSASTSPPPSRASTSTASTPTGSLVYRRRLPLDDRRPRSTTSASPAATRSSISGRTCSTCARLGAGGTLMDALRWEPERGSQPADRPPRGRRAGGLGAGGEPLRPPRHQRLRVKGTA